MSSIKVLNIGRGNSFNINSSSNTKTVAIMSQDGKVVGYRQVEIRRKVFNKRLPWWKRFWKRLFGVKTPDYTVGNYD